MTLRRGLPGQTGLLARLQQPRAQLAVLGALLGVVVLAILLTDVATGGDTESPPPLGSSIEVTPGSRVVVVPTLVPLETPPPVIAATTTPSSEADALARDTHRLDDLALLPAALAKYKERFDEYPANGGNVQTMCAYQDLDIGCDLKEVLSDGEEDILEDPLGESLVNGYWYASDGETYTIWALREGPANPGDPVCAESVPHLRDKGPLFCITTESAPR